MVYEGKRAHSARKRGRHCQGNSIETRLIVCMWVLIAAVIIKIAFPGILSSAEDALTRVMGGGMDLNGALQVLGEAVSGERRLSDALPEAWHQAFQAETDYLQVSAGDMDDEELYGDVTGKTTTVEPDFDEQGTADGDSTNADTMVAAFIASQAAYSDYPFPDNATLERLELGVEGNCPAEGSITSGFGFRENPNGGGVKFHYGLDIGVSERSEVSAFADGTVWAVGDSSSYGIYLILEHEGFRTLYAHLNEVLVSSGQSITIGETVALSGSSGNATGPCLHFEIIVNGLYINPQYYL